MRIEVIHHHHNHSDPEVLRRLDIIMATLDDILNNEADEATQIGVIQTLVANLKQQIADALSGVTLPPAVQAKIDQVFTASAANKASLSAISANDTPPVPAP